MDTHEDNLEFAVSQAVDDVLSDHDRHALADRLRTAEAQRMAADHAGLNELLRGHARAPGLDYDAFAASFGRALAAEESYAPAPIPIRTPWTRRAAVAAAIILTVLAAWPFLPKPGATPAGPAGIAKVDGPTAERPTTAAVTIIAVGPSEALEKQGLRNGLAAGPTKAVPRVVISAVETNADSRLY